MLFTESFITDAGKNLLARAAAQEGAIDWTRAATWDLNTDTYSVQQMNALTELALDTASDKTSSGAVTNAIVNDTKDTASIFCELNNATHNGTARTLGVFAKIHGDESDVLVVAARCGTGVTPTVINPASEGVVRVFVDFTLDIQASQVQAVEATVGYYATAAALQQEVIAREDLESRVVTTNSAGSTSTGENQTILGDKTFSDKVIANGGVTGNLTGNVTGNLTGNVNGMIPVITEDPLLVPYVIPKGCIFLAYVKAPNNTVEGTPHTINAGDIFSAGYGDSQPTVHVLKNNNGTWGNYSANQMGRFCALCGAVINKNAAVLMLLMAAGI